MLRSKPFWINFLMDKNHGKKLDSGFAKGLIWGCEEQLINTEKWLLRMTSDQQLLIE